MIETIIAIIIAVIITFIWNIILYKIDDKWGYKGGVTFIVISLIIDISLLVWMHISL